MEKELLRLEHIDKFYGSRQILEDLNLVIHENEFLTLLGPSGCGKTTTLRLIGGFERPDKGRILFDGQDITKLPPERRQVNTVFQKYSLFSNMDVAENIAFGLKIKGKSAAYIRDKIKYALKLVNLDGYEHADVTALSGGQQQRIAIARAVVNEPKVLLLDRFQRSTSNCARACSASSSRSSASSASPSSSSRTTRKRPSRCRTRSSS